MKIAIDVSELRPGAIGGVATSVRLLLNALHRYGGPDVELLAVAPFACEIPRGIRFVATGGTSNLAFWRSSRALRQAVNGVDLFHSPVTAFPRLNGVPCTATVHELPFVVSPRLEGPLRGVAQRRWMRRAVSDCRRLFAPSFATRRQVESLHPEAASLLEVVPHPSPPAPSWEARDHDGSLLFVGRLDRRKGVAELMRGAASWPGPIRLAGPHTALARRRVLEAAHRAGVAERVTFLGAVSASDLDDLYGRACVVALPSFSEGFGFPVLEAVARGVPIVVGRGTGAEEVAGEVGLAVDVMQPEAVAYTLARAATDEHRAFVRRRGPARALLFTARRTARGYREGFLRALGD